MKHLTNVLESIKTPAQKLVKSQRGVTGLETAIILIAFVVVASVFAFTVLSTGIFSAERGKETVFAGLRQARGSIELKGSVVAEGVPDKILSDAEIVWATLNNVTATVETTDKKAGEASVKLVIDATFTTGLAAYENMSPAVDLSSTDSYQIWVKSSIATDKGDIELLLSGTSGCTGTTTTMDLPALAADTWKLATMGVIDTFDRDATKCVGLNVAVDNAEQTVFLDKIFGRGQATSIILTLANAVEGEPIDLTEPSDSDGDGLSDSIDRKHKMIITYTDAKQLVSDMYWSTSFIGVNDDDDILEVGEKAEITVLLEGLTQLNPLVKDEKFSIEVKPAEGAVLVVQRTMPGKVDAVVNLR